MTGGGSAMRLLIVFCAVARRWWRRAPEIVRHSGAGRNGCGSVCSDRQTSPLVILPRTRSRSDPSSPSAHRLRDCPLGRAHRKTPSLPPVHAPTVKQAILFMRNFLAEEDRGSSLWPALEKKASKQARRLLCTEWCDRRVRSAYKNGVERASLDSGRCLDGIAMHWVADPSHNATCLPHSSDQKG